MRALARGTQRSYIIVFAKLIDLHNDGGRHRLHGIGASVSVYILGLLPKP